MRALLLGVLIALLVPLVSKAQVVVTHPSNPVTKLSKNSIRSIFLMRLTEWNNGDPITVYVLPDSNQEHILFCKDVLTIFPYQLQNSWDRLVFSGTGSAPLVVESLSELKDRVSSTPGAIGYISKDRLDETLKQIDVE